MSNTKNILFMKKILLFVATAMFAISGAAQNMQLSKTATITPPNGENTLNRAAHLRFNAEKFANKTLKTPLKAPQAKATPTGEARDYFFDRIESVSGLGVYERINKVTLYFDGNTVYIPNDFCRSYFDETEPVYFTGTLSGDGTTITIEPGQKVGTFQGVADFYISKADFETGAPLDGSIVLSYDAQTGLIYEETGTFEVDITSDMIGLINYSAYWNFIPAENFTKSERTLTGEGNEINESGTAREPVKVNRTVEDYFVESTGAHIVKGLFNAYPDNCLIMFEEENGDLTLGAQVVQDDELLLVMMPNATQVSTEDVSTFTYDAITNTCTQAAGETILNAFITSSTPDGSFSYNTDYTNLKLGAPTLSGISSITTSDDAKEAVSTQYFDLSGRRVSGAEKGVSIKVMKYADGTSKAVKVMK